MSKEDDKRLANTANRLGLMMDEMQDQLQALCKRMDEAEGTLTKGYIYPKTLPADAVIVIRTEERLSDRAVDVIKDGINRVWSGHKCVLLHGGLSMEIVEGGKQ